MALTELGFKKRTYDEILSGKIDKAKELFGEDIDTSELTPLGKYIRINAYDQALTEEEAEMVYYSIFPNTAIGTSLDRLCVFAGIKRNAATKSRYVVTFTGEAGTEIPCNTDEFLVGTESGINYRVIGEAVLNDDENKTHKETIDGVATIGENGTVTATVECVESGGIGNVLPSEITVIVYPQANIESVIGSTVVLNGTDTEDDYELRQRFNSAIEGIGSCNEAAIKSALIRIPTITHATVIVDEENGCFECFVNNTDDESTKIQVAETIFEKKPIGIKTNGDISQDITDNGGYTHTIRFSMIDNVSVYVKMQIKTNAQFESDGIELIQDNIKTYIDSVGVGKPVILSSLYGLIHSVTGVEEVTLLQLSTDGVTYSTDNITVDEAQSCVCQNVEVNT